ncbi:hypothetical protein ANCDUO_17169 [Ancylostoma duodenale]|uniref:ISXO2-like transposase domain-containing protein n=1 Tax=Ancylostoma duodenale TaxID=51022 RepID=A0A0C2CSF6_9BILA|nr:hypothetical protein ANCDUO_17169 [Ancylostoma duodenale]
MHESEHFSEFQRDESQPGINGYERGSGRPIVILLQRRNTVTLMGLIVKFIMPDTKIVSDCWRGYNRIAHLPQGFRHLNVNLQVQKLSATAGGATAGLPICHKALGTSTSTFRSTSLIRGLEPTLRTFGVIVIECHWQKSKNLAKHKYGINNRRYSDYISELLWRKRFGK